LKKPLTEGRQALAWGCGVAVLAVVERLLLAIFYPPVSYNDTASYRRLAEAVARGWSGYDGTRTPGFPVFMALAGSDRNTYLAQLGLGFLMTLAFFYIGWKATRLPAFGGALALAHTLNLGQLFFEADLITENLSTFFIVVAMLGVFVWLETPRWRSFWLAAIIGAATGLATLTRPIFIYLPFWIVVFLGFSLKPGAPFSFKLPGFLKAIRIQWAGLLAVLIPAGLFIGGWALYIYVNYHMLSLTTMNGYHLVQHTGNFFELVPDKYAALRDTYLRYRAQRIAQYGTQGNTIWDAIPEMQRVSGLSFYDLSRTLQRISFDLILHHPFLYLQNVVSGWWMFWRAPVYWSAGGIPLAGLRPIFEALVMLERYALFAGNMLFILTSLLALAWGRFRRAIHLTPFLALAAGSVWLASVVQTLLDHGDNPRFLIPLQTWVVFWVMWVAYYGWQNRAGLLQRASSGKMG